MVNEDFSCIKEVTKIVNLSLPSMYNTNEIGGICDTLETWKRQYVKQLQGIVVGYKNVALTSKLGYVKADTPVIYCNVKATFELFFPTIGSIIKGKINRISQDYIGCLVHNTINVTVHRTTDTPCDISNYVNLDHFILFKITRIIFKSKIIHVKGKITEECITLMKSTGMINDNTAICDNDIQTTCASPDFSSSSNVIFNNPSTSDYNALESDNFITFNDTSSQFSSPKKKKKHKKSKENSSVSSSISESLENDSDRVESTQSLVNIKKRKRKKSDTNFTSPTGALEDDTESMHPKKKIKTEDPAAKNINQVELIQSTDKSRKRKRKKSEQSSASSSNITLENETEPIHQRKKMKIEEHMMNDRVEILDQTSSDMFSNILPSANSSLSAVSPVVNSPNVASGIENSPVKVEFLSPVKKKKHKKSKSSLESTFLPEGVFSTEINITEPAPHQIPNETSLSSDIKSEAYTLTSPDLFDEHLNKERNEPEPAKLKKKEKSDKNRTLKKKKDKDKKSSKKDKKKKLKVISTKKKLHGHKIKLKKKKSKDSKKSKSKDTKKSKSKDSKKGKSKKGKTKHVPE